MARSVTLEDIAKAAGVSKATVSYALRGHSSVSAKTAERIQGLAKDMGYVRHPAFAAMRAHRHDKAKDVPLPVVHLPSIITKDHGERERSSLAKAGTNLGYSVRNAYIEDDTDLSALNQRFLDEGVVGILIRHQPRIHELLSYDWQGLAVITIGYSPDSCRYHGVCWNIWACTELALTKAYEAGYRRIGGAAFAHVPEIVDDRIRRAAFRSFAMDHDDVEPIPPYCAPMWDYDGVVHWYEAHRPDCVIGFSNREYAELTDAGHHPAYISLHAPVHPDELKKLACVNQRHDLITSRSLAALDQAIRYRDIGVPKERIVQQLPPAWIPGPSLPVKKSR